MLWLWMIDHLYEVSKYKDKIVQLDDDLNARDKLIDFQRRNFVDLREHKYSLQLHVDELQLDLESEKDEVLRISEQSKNVKLLLLKTQK